MTSVTHEPAGGAVARHRPAGHASLAGALRSEFTKIRSVRSTYWTLLAMIVAVVGIGALFSFGRAQAIGQAHGAARAAMIADAQAHAAMPSLFGLFIGQLVIVVLGVLTISSEYSTGMVRTSLTVLPRRGTMFAAKALVFGAVALAAGLIASFAAFFLGQAILATQHAGWSISHPGALRAVVGGALFLTVCGLLSYGLGAILRHTAGAITAAIGLLFVLFILSGFLPANWAVHIDRWIPFNAGGAIWENQSGVHMFGPWTGFAVFCCYAAAAIAGGLLLFRHRDA